VRLGGPRRDRLSSPPATGASGGIAGPNGISIGLRLKTFHEARYFQPEAGWASTFDTFGCNVEEGCRDEARAARLSPSRQCRRVAAALRARRECVPERCLLPVIAGPPPGVAEMSKRLGGIESVISSERRTLASCVCYEHSMMCFGRSELQSSA